ncbi:MAG TPA: SDR family NAD(P)-dependent oxidoreductase [Pseudonocardiaceae bacterium]|nr:SDR family NAD(P)-dependent oxidoreductase [Pseudonocardiaceae bacterium]
MNSSDTEPAGRTTAEPVLEPIAIIGLACRLPGARDADQFWQNLAGGVESIRFTSLEEQADRGVPERDLRDPNFVPAVSILDDYEFFDAAFFGMSAREAELRDPQHRLMLELTHTALEDAGYDPARYPGEIGVYAGAGENGYEWHFTRRNRKVFDAAGVLSVAINSHPDFLATLISYKLNLRGPSLTVHTACSTSLVAVHLACEALRAGECDMAVSGGVSIDMPPGRGYVHVPDGIYSADGHCRAFDANATGTLWGNGGGVVILKRLSDALADGDHVRSLVMGNAINNDGATKVGFTAPSEDGQAAVVANALAVSGVDARSVSYVEAHGTATALGDPIEVAALSRAYGRDNDDTGWCALGSLKTNVGHLGHAAGIASVIKTSLALEHELIPPTLHFERPNPAIDFDVSPFHVNTTLSAWKANGHPRRAGVSSFGMGGTNGHLIMQEAPRDPVPPGQARPTHLIQLSARSQHALTTAAQRLARHLAEPRDPVVGPPDLADVAHTLRVGRRELAHRLAVVATDPADAAAALADPKRLITGTVTGTPPRVAFLFSGQGAQYAGMAAQLHRTEPVFRDTVDECGALLRDDLGFDLREVLFATDDDAPDRLRRTEITQPALFVVGYALAQLWQSWGVRPDGLVGHSIGEYVAATMAGVFDLPDALRLVAARGRLMQRMPAGVMLAVQLDEAATRDLLPDGVSVATVNGPGSCVVSGPADLVDAVADRLSESGVGSRRLRTSHAFHSPMMEPILAEFRAVVAGVPRHAPNLPVLSNVTGGWLTAAEATDPSYWATHLRETVRFGDCLATLLADGEWLLVECGPGRQLSGLVRLQGKGKTATALPSLPHLGDRASDLEVLSAAAGRLWASGVPMDLTAFGEPARRVPLPTYPWERKYYWVKPDDDSDDFSRRMNEDTGPRELSDWFTVPVWRQLAPAPATLPLDRCLVFADPATRPVVDALTGGGTDVVLVTPGDAFGGTAETGYTVRPAERADYDALLADLAGHGGVPARVVHAWTLGERAGDDPETVWRQQDLGFFCLLALVQALADTQPDDGIRLDVLTCGTQDVIGGDLVNAGHSTVAGIAKVVPLEMGWLTARQWDLDPTDGWPAEGAGARARLLADLRTDLGDHDTVAVRGGRHWYRDYEPVTMPADLTGLPAGPGLRDKGVYLITGGLGGIGITLAEYLAQQVDARLVLLSRSELPPRDEWDGWVAVHGTVDRTGRAIAAIRRMEAEGADVLTMAADVGSPADLARVRETVLARFGQVDGIVHAAGVPGGGMAEVKERASAEAVLRPKILGTLALRAAFGADHLDFVVLCSSLYSIAGEFGQVDYCAGNTFLDAHARSGDGWRATVVSANWGSWLDVGMSAEVAAPAAFRALQRGDKLIAIDHPMLTRRYAGDQDNPGWSAGTLRPDTHWVLGDHRIAGVPVLPGTAQLEAIRRAVEEVYPAPSPRHVIALRDVVFVEPMSVPDGGSAELRVVLSSGADGIEFQSVSLSGGTRRTHAQGVASWVEVGEPSVVDIAEIRARCDLATRQRDDAFVSVTGLITFGPHWGNVRVVHEGAQEELAELTATPATEAALAGWGMCPSLLDEATAFGRTGGDDHYLPLGYGRITIRRPLPARFYSHLRHRDTGSEEVCSRDLTLYDESGREIVSIEEFTLRHVDADALSGALTAAAGAATGPVPGEALAGAGSGYGIRPADGAEAFRRLVTTCLGGQVTVSVMPVDQVIASSRAFTQETVADELDATRSAPQVERAAEDGYVAPRTDLEATVARIWGDSLGVAQVGVTDDFFQIGGDSLVAVQLLATVRSELGVRLPMRSVFEEPTVAGVAARIEELRRAQPAARQQPAGEPAEVVTSPSVIPRLRRPGAAAATTSTGGDK